MHKNIFYFVIACCMTCSVPPAIKKYPGTFTYETIKNLRIVYATPVVISSEIYYDNRYTNQNYHSMDRDRTKDAFCRDLQLQLKREKCNWRACKQQVDKAIAEEFFAVDSAVDRMPLRICETFRRDSVDIAILLYALHYYHEQSVGSRQMEYGTVNAYGTVIHKKINYLCSVFDVKSNKAIVTIPVKNIQQGQAFNIIELSIKELFDEVMHRK